MDYTTVQITTEAREKLRTVAAHYKRTLAAQVEWMTERELAAIRTRIITNADAEERPELAEMTDQEIIAYDQMLERDLNRTIE